MNLRTLGLTLMLVGAFSASAKALTTENFNFTLINPHAQNATGELFGLTEQTPGDPTSYIPTSIEVLTGPGITTPLNETFATGLSVQGTGFTITGGAITAANYADTFTTVEGGAQFNYTSGTNNIEIGTPSFLVENTEGFSGVLYSAGSVPEPSQYGAFIFLAAAGFIARRRFSRASWTV